LKSLAQSVRLSEPNKPSEPTPKGEMKRDLAFVLACQDNLVFMRGIPSESIKLVVTSPPYNLGKEYESRHSLKGYLEMQEKVIRECVRVLHPQGSICW
jgi:adenine-specific DNA-methyltransferase